MYLKSVSMFGFKTFARRTVFEFREGVTAVVGPNGSGKSNLVDAITWALGEQSMRSIRGRKLEEVVYHGSASRKPLGFAEVVLTFDNDDGYFPLPQSEISITRRYFKSGESEFAINNEPCRLKDIQELLIDTGLSTTNYSIINQGDVEYVIDLSPSQRREIFDEAAGINKYKIEKTKTLSKIKDTNINISRLKDILTEISEALGPLKEQAEKAKRYDEIVEEMERLKLGVFASEIRRLKSRLEQLSIEGEGLKAKRAEGLKKVGELRQSRENVGSGIDAARTEIDSALRELADIGSKLARAEESARLLARAVEDADRRAAAADVEKADILNQEKTLEKDIKDLRAKAEQKKRRLDEAAAELESATKQSSDDLKLNRKELAEKRDGLLPEAEELKKIEARLAGELAVAKDRLAGMAARVKSMTIARDSARDRLTSARERGKSESDKASQLERQAREKESQAEKLRAGIEQAASAREKARSALDAVVAERDVLSARIEAIERVAGLIAVSEKGKSTARLADEVEIKAGYEPAARRALNELLNASVSTADEAVAALDGAAEGGAARLVLDWFSGAGAAAAANLKKKKWAKRLLSDVVSIKASAPKELLNVFSMFALADTDEEMREAISELPAGAGVVRADGAACFVNGTLFTGEALPTSEAAKERIAELKSALEEKIAAVKSARAAREETEKKYASLRSSSEAAGKEFNKLNIELATARERAAAAGERVEVLAKDLEAAEKALAEFAATGGGSESDVAKIESEFVKVSEKRKSLESELKSAQCGLDEIADAFRKREMREVDLRVEMGELRREIEAAGDAEKYRQAELERVRRRSGDIDADKSKLSADRLRTSEEMKAGEALAKELGAARAAAESNLAQKRGALKSLEDENLRLRGEIHAVETRLEELKEAMLDSEMRCARAETQLEEIRRQFSEEFDNVTEERALDETADGGPAGKGRYLALKKELETLQPVNMLAIGEYEEKSNRYDLLSEQIGDLEDARATLLDIVNEYDDHSRAQFMETFERVREKFQETFVEMFGGGEAELMLVGDGDPLESGVDVSVQVPGKRMRAITLLSGGEKALCALVLIFSILKVKPSPFYVLDEVDAGLDESNIVRFREMLRKHSTNSQFLVVTHNKGTLVGADQLFGITMDKQEGYSKLLTVSME
jgi:chromosome segregation protein